MKQLLIYFILVYIISWLIWLPLYGHVFGLTDLPLIPFNHAIGGFGPLIAAFLTTWIFLKKDGIKNLVSKMFQIKPLIYFAIALLSPFILVLLASVISCFVNHKPINISGLLTTKEFPEWSFFTFLIYNLLFFGFGEEVGWRGFALPRLQVNFNAVIASIILTLFWALWHLPLFFIDLVTHQWILPEF